MSVVEKMTHFIDSLKTPTRMLLNASAGGTLRTKNEDGVKRLIENMFQNEYHSSDRAVKQKRILEIDSNTKVLAQLDVILKQLVASSL